MFPLRSKSDSCPFFPIQGNSHTWLILVFEKYILCLVYTLLISPWKFVAYIIKKRIFYWSISTKPSGNRKHRVKLNGCCSPSFFICEKLLNDKLHKLFLYPAFVFYCSTRHITNSKIALSSWPPLGKKPEFLATCQKVDWTLSILSWDFRLMSTDEFVTTSSNHHLARFPTWKIRKCAFTWTYLTQSSCTFDVREHSEAKYLDSVRKLDTIVSIQFTWLTLR